MKATAAFTFRYGIYLLLLVVGFSTNQAMGQANIVRVEYFIDSDPGFGNAIGIPVANTANIVDQVHNINVSSIADGLHNLFLRSKDANGKWSVTNRTTFYRSTLGGGTLPNIVKAEYFFDNDPGFGNAIAIPLIASNNIADQSVSINLSAVTDGIHNLYIRTQDANGKWSISNRSTFYRSILGGALPNIIKAEYFFDTDPGFGSGINIPVTASTNIADQPVSINISAVADGIHNLYIRSQDANGKWSITNRSTFYRSTLGGAALPNITKAEYFFDTDPGFGSGINIPVTASANIADQPVSINLSAVADGLRNLFIRTRDANGKWSVTNRSTFYRSNLVGAALPNITKAEYFIDTDPGFGAAINIPVSPSNNIKDQSVNVNVGAVPAGIHNLYVRTQDANGKWSISNRATFFRPGGGTALPNVVKAEYFVDTDPGFGLATNIPITPGINIADVLVNVDLFPYTVGKHFLFLRSVDADGKWSITNMGSFTKPAPTELIISIGAVTPDTLCAGGTIQIPFTINAAYNAGNVYTAQLSNGVGNFDLPVAIGTLSGIGNGSITATVPTNIAAGTNYRVRILSNNPADISDTSLPITVNRIPSEAFTIGGKASVCLLSEVYTINSAGANTIYTWSLPTGGTFSPATGTSTTVNWTTAGPHILTATASNNCGIGNNSTLNITALSGVPMLIPGITVNNRTLTASALVAGASAYQWFQNSIIINGAISQTFTVPNIDFGGYSVAYTNGCGKGNASTAVMVALAKLNQTITFTPVAAKTFGDAAFSVSATASSNLVITYYTIESGPATISGNTITISGAGTIVVKAVQDGNATFNTAENTLQVIVNKATATVAITNNVYTYDGLPKAAVAETTPLGLNTSLAYNGSAAAPAEGGTYTVLATITSPNYAGTATGTLVINKSAQTISISPVANKNFNDVPFIVAATSTSGLTVTFSITTVPATGIASINGNIITLPGAGGSVTITANQAGNSNYEAAPLASTSFEVRPPAAKDVQIISLVAPANGCGLGITAPITIRIRNTGTQAATGFPVSYQISSDPPVTEIFTGSIGAGSNTDFTFTTRGIFAQTGISYPIKLYTALSGDEKLNNDTLLASSVRFAPAVMSVSKDTSICAGGQATLKTFGAGSTLWTNGPSNSTFVVSPANTTTYTATVTDFNGCVTERKTATVTVNANPLVNAGADVAILRGSSTNLQASGAANYLWNNGVNTAANVVSPAATTTFNVTGTNANGCSATDAVTVTVNFSAITVSPGLLQFGGVVVDSTKILTVTVTNTGTLAETITGIAGVTAPFFTTIVAPISLPAGTSVQIPVSFSPAATLISQATMDIATSAGNFSIALRGTGVTPAAAWTVTPSTYNFGKVQRNTSVTQNLVVKNTGNIAIKISAVSSSSLRFAGGTNSILDIPVGASINLAVRFNPIAITSYTGSITVRSSTAGLPLLRPMVAGNGFIPGNPPALEFLNRPPLDGTDGVTPGVGQPGFYTYSILYKHPDGLAPMSDFPKLGIDKNTDNDFADAGEGIFTMTKEGNSTNWAAGVVYTFTTSLTASELYGYQFFATDVNGNDALITEYKKGPVVTREILDLHIYASDIVFSKPNPAVNENFTVTATINNNSPYSAANVPLRFYFKDSLFLFNDTIPFIDGKSTESVTHTLNFSPDGFYPIKVWIDSAKTLGEGNLLNNYASRPVIVGDFTVPGTIDLVSNATPSGCSRGKVTFSGRATYRGLNLAGTPPVEGADVTITITNYQGAPRTIKTTTDIFGNWYYYDDPCRNDPDDGCVGYICGITYNYTVEVTDFTLTSPSVPGSVTRQCVPCNSVPKLSQAVGVSGCILQGAAFTAFGSITNFISTVTGGKICAPTVYRDTITLYIDGQLMSTFTEDSIISCDRKTYTYNAPGMAVGTHELSMNHIYYFANNERTEQTSSVSFEILPLLAELAPNGISKTGYTSFIWGESNTVCGVTAGRHMMYLYDSLPGYTEKILIDSALVENLAPQSGNGFSYSNPLLAPGCHYLTIVSDSKAQVAELIETNNINEAQFCVIKPDLAFHPRGKNGNIRVSSSTGTPGSLINFASKVSNYGGPVNQPFSVQFKANGILLGGKINIPSLAAGEETTVVSVPFTVPTSQCPVQITAMVDSDRIIDEEQEKNNFDTLQYGINIKAGRKCEDEDNIGSGFFGAGEDGGECLPYISTRGVLTNYATTVRNTGSRDARNVKVQFRWNGIEIGTDVIPLLKAGQGVESGFFYAFDTVGQFIINAFADYTREICEINELDNIGNIHIDVKRSVADLEILSQYIAPSNLNPEPGQTITIVSSVLNKGDAPSTPAKIRFWVNDVQLGDDIQIDSLYPGMDTTVMATVTYSSTIVGPKIIKVTADIENEVLERTKNNNEATRAVIIGGAPDFARAKSEAITLHPSRFIVGDTIIIRHYIRNYGGDGGAAWVRFYYRNIAGEKILIDSIRIGLESNDSTRIGLRWKVPEAFGQIITEIGNSIPPEFDELNNIDSLPFGIALPLTLLSFDGVVRNNIAQLSWRSTNEINVRHFELERSINGNRYIKIATLPATNGSGTYAYQYADSSFKTMLNGSVYYRLKITDDDGIYRYSIVVTLLRKLQLNQLKIYPNPVQHNLMVQVQANAAGKYSIEVMDIIGRMYISKQFNVQQGSQTLSIPVQSLSAGIYVLVIQDAAGNIKEVKFIKD